MDIGIGIPNSVRGTTGAQLLEWARRAEAAGFSSLGTIGRVAYPSYEELTVLAAAGTVTGAVVAPLWGRAIDRVGQARVLLGAAVINVLSVALLVTTIELAWPLALSVVAAIGAGVGFSMVPAIRASRVDPIVALRQD